MFVYLVDLVLLWVCLKLVLVWNGLDLYSVFPGPLRALLITIVGMNYHYSFPQCEMCGFDFIQVSHLVTIHSVFMLHSFVSDVINEYMNILDIFHPGDRIYHLVV